VAEIAEGMPGGGYGFWLDAAAVEPADDPTWAVATQAMRDRFWAEARRVAAAEWDASRARGLSRRGRALTPISERTRERRRSAMGTADPSAPPLIPAWELSRTRSFLLHKTVRGKGAWFYFRRDPRVKGSWGKILHYHATGQARGGKVRDVMGFTPRDMRAIRRRMTSWWHARRPRIITGPDRLAVVGKPPVDLPAPRIVQTARGRIVEGQGIRFNLDTATMGVGREGVFERAEFIGTFRGKYRRGAGPGPAPAPPDRPAPRPPASPVQSPPPAPVRGRPVLPNAPIRERLAAYADGDAKVARLAALQSDRDRVLAQWETTRREHRAWLQEHGGNPVFRPGSAEYSRERDMLARSEELLEQSRAASSEIRDQVVELLGAETRHGLATVRRFRSDQPASEAVDRAELFLEKLLQRVPGDTTPGLAVEIRTHRGNYRANANGRKSQVNISKSEDARTVAHEIAHVIELKVPGVLDAVKEFLAYRVGSEKPRRLGKLFKGHGYSLWETGREDQFGQYFSAAGSDGKFSDVAAWYVGKQYSHDATEVLSMGIEALYTDARGFAAKDPEFCKFIVGILDGSLR
jgi:hypothetical protein